MALISSSQYRSIFIAGFALILNVIGIYVIHKQSSQRTHQNLIILNLSILIIPFSCSSLFTWIFVVIGIAEHNRFSNLASTCVITSRVAVIAMLTFDRLFAIKYTLRYTILVSKRKVKVVLCAIWALWVASFSILAPLRINTFRLVCFVIVVPVIDCLLLLSIVYAYSYIYWIIRKRAKKLE